jgi:asparagine synthase (glutamine-hydrolysing)
MCGIGGCVVSPGSEVPRAALERMVLALIHRGPDDHGIEVVGPVGLVHTRLAIVDPTPVGHQPMRSADDNWWLTYNGEAFNHLELRRRLDAPWRGGSDTETVVEALAAWGEPALREINGLFALGAVDGRGRRLLLARDRFGVKPLYIAHHAGTLWFASEIGALLAAGIPRVPDPEILLHAIARGWANGPWTPIAGVTRVAPGTTVSVDLDTLETTDTSWYDPAMDAVDRDRGAALSGMARGELRAALETELRESVRRRLMGDVPIGTMCSGGIDSSLITALAAQHDGSVSAFNVSIADQPEHDEGAYARMVAAHLGVELHTATMTAASWRAGLVEAVAHVEYPLLHPNSVPMAQVAGLAHSHGVKVLLSGEGADELFAGYSFLHGPERRDFAARRTLSAPARRIYRWLGRHGLRRAAPPHQEGLSGRVTAHEQDLRERALTAYAHHRGPRRLFEAGLLTDLGTYLPNLLNRQDKTTMQQSIETRIPFLDPNVVGFVSNLPLEARVAPGEKGLLRELALEHIPREAVERGKRGFGFDAERYLAGAADPEFLLDGRLREVLGYESNAWREGATAARFHVAVLLWTAEIWCRSLLDGASVDTIEAALWRDVEAPLAAPESVAIGSGVASR